MNMVSGKFYEAFQNRCLSLFIDGYRKMKAEKLYKLDWDENQFSDSLCVYITEQKTTNLQKINIRREHHLTNPNVKDGTAKADEANEIDFWMNNWNYPNPVEFHAEAKNLAEDDWTKQCGAKVWACNLRARYIDTGIDKITSSKYPSNSFLIGYILQGNINNIKQKINALLEKRRRARETLLISDPVNSYDNIFYSNHNRLKIIHLFLKF